MTTAHIVSDPIAQLWQGARAWFSATLAAFGDPARFAALSRETACALKRDLKALESVVLKLLLIEAARFFLRPPIPGLARKAGTHAPDEQRAAQAERAQRSAGLQTRISDDGAEERASQDPRPCAPFSLRLPPEPSARRSRAHSTTPRAPHEPKPDDLARRCEALRAVLADPAAAVARLVRKLCTLAERAYAVARRIALWRPRGTPRNPTLTAHVCVYAHDSASILRNTT
jgi:hypothetical protein